jgi:hypothetical protein
MRRAAGLVLLLGYLLCGGACSGGYPLPPTRCDEFCDATKGFNCEEFYEPAACVSQCEQDNTAAEACRPQFDAAVSCFRKAPGAVAALCDFSSDGFSSAPCRMEEDALTSCSWSSSCSTLLAPQTPVPER